VNDWTIIFRSLRARLFSTVTTVLMVGMAVALMLVLLTMRGAGQKAFERGSGDMHLMVSADDSPLVAVLNGVFYANPPRRAMTWAKHTEIARSAPFAYAIPTQIGDNFEGIPVLATKPEFFTKFRPNPGEAWALADGRFFQKSFEVVLGAQAARSSGLMVGSELHLTHGMSPLPAPKGEDHDEHAHDENLHNEFTYTVVGVLEPTGGSHDRAMFTDLTSSWIIHAHEKRKRAAGAEIPPTTEADLTDADRLITGMYLRLITREGSDVASNLPQVFGQLRRDPTIVVAAPRQEIDKLFRIVRNIDTLFFAVAVVVMISSAVAIMLALYNSMEQRRRQVAVMRVLGASAGHVFGLIVTESALIGVLGAALGVALGLGGSLIAAEVLQSRVGLAIDPSLPPGLILYMVLVSVLLAAAAGLIPAMMAYRTSVAKNLRPMA
jgi:putative ABC transport system permease protein